MNRNFTNRRYLDAIEDHVVIFDGAMGTEIQRLSPKPEDFPDGKDGFNDGLILSRPEWIKQIHRSYLEAGADCVFFMMAVSREVIQTLVKEVPAPVSVLARRETPPLAELQELGVARVSYGYDFALMAAGAIRRLAQEIQDAGTITALQDAMPMPEFIRLMS